MRQFLYSYEKLIKTPQQLKHKIHNNINNNKMKLQGEYS
jgi:hypothetical protein